MTPHDGTHPLNCDRPPIRDRIVFDKLVQVLIFACDCHSVADKSVSATTQRRRRDTWIAASVMDALLDLSLAAYNRMIGLDLSDLAIDGCITTAPCGGGAAGRSPVGRGKQGVKHSIAVAATVDPANDRRIQCRTFLTTVPGFVSGGHWMRGTSAPIVPVSAGKRLPYAKPHNPYPP